MDATEIAEPTLNTSCLSPACQQQDYAEIEKRYEAERHQQLQTRGKIPDVDIRTNTRFEQFSKDPWLDDSNKRQQIQYQQRLHNGKHHKVLIIGAGYGGLLFAVRIVQTGAFTADDILIVDTAGGFGGTWYWNRYPGLMCDVESYIYMPLLEETGYMPRDKYASGPELRIHAERIALTWKLSNRAMFAATVRSLNWDERENQWIARGLVLNDEKGQRKETSLQLSADFVFLASGIFASPKIPEFRNIMEYQGHMFHTSRWDYDCTGGSPEDPKLCKLGDKKVGIIGTGATAIQVVPHLAQYSRKLQVFQRTPSAVDKRNNHPTDPVWWNKMLQSEGPGWQKRRMENFNAFTGNEQPQPAVDMIADGWTSMPSFSIIGGSPESKATDYLHRMKAFDFPRQERIRERVRETVHNTEVAEALSPWYPGWCKRPCFHDQYLAAFNRPNVRLIDVRQSGIDYFTPKGLVVDGREHEIDVLVFSTGYTTSRLSPGGRADIAITGRNGLMMEHKWHNGLATLHGVITRDFPNLFFPGPSQAGTCLNHTYTLDQLATHVAYIISETLIKIGAAGAGNPPRVVIEPTKEAEEDWAVQVLARAATHGALSQCTPGYYNRDGMASDIKGLSMEDKMKLGRMVSWGEGIGSYMDQIENWRGQGELRGLEIHCVD
ncbi:FAD/NAD(P)-binding domain-containing protein [Aspergillus udagawae]|uniref:FAD/NAD(P)-binding domain-containing protein n=1 Tax=Aspergillus udagawae TaxID=91492 RepID=A0ABQ1ACJ1_9EURO|nr:FAD/NAD(P)-binding domain-containing protein [Aspergillus udagawae]GFG11769.1 FAD/NAD(P)-binding domain-containing protein [Aspergillus udagawae]